MTIRGIGSLKHGLLLVALLASAAFVGCGGSESAGPQGPDSTIVKAREAAHQEKLKLQADQKAQRGR